MSARSANGARVVVLGGGFGGLETAFDLHMLAGDRAQITLVSDQDHFLFKPNSIYVPFGLDPARLRVPLAKPARRRGIEFVQARADGIDPDARQVQLGRRTLPYDFLVIATGAGMRPEEIPGLAEHAISTWTPEDMMHLRAGFQTLVDKDRPAGKRRRVLFLVPPNNKCAGPLYEIVLMLETWLRRQHARETTEIVWTTYEDTYIQAFGPRLHEVVSEEFERRGISGHHGWIVDRIEPDRVHYSGGEELGYDLLVAFPPYVASAVFGGLQADDRGFWRPTSPAGVWSAIQRSSPSAMPATSRSSRPSSPSSRPTPPPPTSRRSCSARRRSRASIRSACA